MPSNSLNLTPDPKVLVALTRTPLKPLDALCELIDNALDGFRIAEAQGNPVKHPYITIEIPGKAEISRGSGVLRVRDNGPGMAPEVAEKALRAGYSSNNPFDSLGLFGMGFNISTGKLGRTTVFKTLRAEDDAQLVVRIDLEEIMNSGSYEVPADLEPQVAEFPHGTVVEISDWWPTGDPNHGFARKLAQESKQLLPLIGRRYSSILRDRNVRIMINGNRCEAYEHCAWSSERYVERAGHGQIPARIDFNEAVGSQKRCSECFTLIEADETECPACGSHSFRTVEERIKGWVGIQRFDDETDFGIDLIRNGRTIKVGEKSAFFEYADELGKLTRDYPIDQQYGRIIGEVHLDHVPVDFQKQDFQKSTREWDDAIKYLRGESSLQPRKPGADQNQSPVFRLYQGYRKVRNVGRADMYMGQWDPGSDKPKRVGRDLEQDYYRRFVDGEPGYKDDAEWWKLVESADKRPLDEFVECPECGADNLKANECCDGCDYVLVGHDCAGCGTRVPASAHACPACGQSQLPDDASPWPCAVCDNENPHDLGACGQCSYPRGTPSLGDPAHLEGRSQQDESLSIRGCSVELASGQTSNPVDVEVRRTKEHITPVWKGAPVPLITAREASQITVYVDPRHQVFLGLDVRLETLIASEVAHFIYMANQSLAASHRGQHSVSAIASAILANYYGDMLDLSPESVRESVAKAIGALRLRMAEALDPGEAADAFEVLEEDDQKAFAANLVGSGRKLTEADSVVERGEFFDFLEPVALVRIFEARPELVMSDLIGSSQGSIAPGIAKGLAMQQIEEVSRALADCASYPMAANPSEQLTRKTKASLGYLLAKLDL